MGELSLAELGLLTLAEAAARRGVCTTTVRRWIAAGLDHAVVGTGRGKHYVFRPEDVDAYVPNRRGAPAGPRQKKRDRAKGTGK